VVAVGPNPFRGYTTVVYTVGAATAVHGRVYDLRGRLAADLGTRIAAVGRNEWTWDGYDGEGRRQPGGLYVLELDAAGHKLRVQMTLLH
jgi:flagellar hook assembly protein FlgD